MNTFSIQEAFQYGFEAMKKNFKLFLGLLVVIFAFAFLIELLGGGMSDSNALGQSSLGLVNFIFDTLVGLSMIYIGLQIFDGKTPTLKNATEPYYMFLRYLGGSILFAVMMIIGFILLIIPGIYVAVTYGLFQYVLIDKNMGPIEALKESARITKGNKLKLLGFGILVGILNVIGALLLLVGLFVTIPMSIMASIYVYKSLLEGAHISSENEETHENENASDALENTESSETNKE